MSGLETVRVLLYGWLTLGSGVAALFFFKYWRQSRDRLFASFTAAFVLLAINWAALPFVPAVHESRELFYLIRLLAFLVIVWAIIDKNRAR